MQRFTATLGMTGDDDTSHLEDYLDADFIIVDEFSMVDTWLANQLFSNISSNSKSLSLVIAISYLLSVLVKS